MKKFPEIKDEQVVLLRAEFNTGHVLDEQFNLVISDNQKAYTVLNSVEEAIVFAKEILAEKENQIEYVIYNRNQEVLHYFNPFRIK